mgnify:FL=1
MLGKIIYVNDNTAHIKINLSEIGTMDLLNIHVVFEDDKKRILGEVQDISEEMMIVHFLGEIVNDKFIGGVIRKPNMQSKLRIINQDELKYILGENNDKSFLVGYSPLYDSAEIRCDVNDLFSNHMAIFGNSGSGKSWGVASLLQNVFENPNLIPYRSNFFIFDTYGEYRNAFSKLNEINPNFRYKCYSTNETEGGIDVIRIPIWLLKTEEMALLLDATDHSQLQMIEKAIKLANIFAEGEEMAEKYKNHLIAKAIMTILYTNQTAANKRNDIFSILNDCSTDKFNLEAPVQGIGYVRKFRECFTIDKDGSFTESILVTQYISSFIDESLDNYDTTNAHFFTLKDLEKAFDFTLISEGLLKNERTYGPAVELKVKLHSILVGENAKYFSYPQYIGLNNYIASIVTCNDGKKAQIVDFNLEEVEDRIAKVITKIYAKMLFDFTKRLKNRASIPFHIVIEEAHRYVKDDIDEKLIGYNIFARIAKEGRKYGLLLNLISQRPVDISEGVISQCSNFFMFKMTHPRDLEYMKQMLPNMSQEIMDKQKSLQPGTCVAFGSAFKVSLIAKMRIPSPTPYSSNCDIINTWK